MDYSAYIDNQLATATNDIPTAVRIERERLAATERSANPMYTGDQIASIMAECDEIVNRFSGQVPGWNPDTREALSTFLTDLREGDYLTPKECFDFGKRREYKQHLVKLSGALRSPDAIVLDVAGRTGYVSTVLSHLGFPRALTVELSPLNVITGRYVWGHRSIIQGDAHDMSACRHDDFDFSGGEFADVVFARYCLEHFLDLRSVFDEFLRLLKPGGVAYLIVGQGVRKSLDTGDIHAFPDAASVYSFAPDMAMVWYELEQNAETGAFQHFIMLQKPDHDRMLTPHRAQFLTKRPLAARIADRLKRMFS